MLLYGNVDDRPSIQMFASSWEIHFHRWNSRRGEARDRQWQQSQQSSYKPEVQSHLSGGPATMSIRRVSFIGCREMSKVFYTYYTCYTLYFLV